ncbi:MAG: hypothetical protein AAF846_18475 [Chloroflexota bacterium]
MKRIDESKGLIKGLESLSNWLARQRGLPIVVGIVFVILGGALEFVNIFVDNTIIEVLEVSCRTFGLVTALIGFALLEPLG